MPIVPMPLRWMRQESRRRATGFVGEGGIGSAVLGTQAVVVLGAVSKARIWPVPASLGARQHAEGRQRSIGAASSKLAFNLVAGLVVGVVVEEDIQR
jgi:hypothetical protein